MKTTQRAILLGVAVVATVLVSTSLPAFEAVAPIPAAPTRSRTKVAVLDCSHGWRASAQGQFGGAGFTLSCHNGRDRQQLVGAAGTTYSVRVGAESDAVALDCFFSGDASSFNETCGAVVRISVR